MSSNASEPGDSENQATPTGEGTSETQAQQGEPSSETEPSTGTEEVAPETPSPESQLPPEAQGEMNGGPLGCCLGVTVGLVLSVSVPLISRAFGDPLISLLGVGWLSLLVRVLMVVVAFVAVLLCGRLGWKIGRRIYREYPAPVVRVRQRRR